MSIVGQLRLLTPTAKSRGHWGKEEVRGKSYAVMRGQSGQSPGSRVGGAASLAMSQPMSSDPLNQWKVGLYGPGPATPESQVNPGLVALHSLTGPPAAQPWGS